MKAQFLIIVFAISALVSCSVSKSKLAKNRASTISDFALDNFNGDYKNDNSFCFEKIDTSRGAPPSLWNILYSCKKFKEDTVGICANCLVALNYDGSKRLTVKLIHEEETIRQIELKAKIYKNNLAIKRKLFLIPIPIFFYVRHERKVLLANNPDKSLNVGYSKIDEGEIIFGVRDNYLYTLYFLKQEK